MISSGDLTRKPLEKFRRTLRPFRALLFPETCRNLPKSFPTPFKVKSTVASFSLVFLLFFAITPIHTEPLKCGHLYESPGMVNVPGPGVMEEPCGGTDSAVTTASIDHESQPVPEAAIEPIHEVRRSFFEDVKPVREAYAGPDVESPNEKAGAVPDVKHEAAETVETRPSTAYKRKEPAGTGWAPRDISRGPRDRMEISITFDGHFNGREAGEILDALKERGIRTTIFLTGGFIRNHPEVTRRIVSDGHEVGNHTMNHPHLTDYSRTMRHRTLPGITEESVVRELREAEELFKKTTGAEMAPLWRAPYGEINGEIIRWAYGAGYVHVNWTSDPPRRESLDTLDWVSDTKSSLYLSAEGIKKRILSFGKGGDGVRGGIILMHLGTERASDRASCVLGEMMDELMGRGYRFVKVSSLMEGTAEGRAIEALDRSKEGRAFEEVASLEDRRR